MLDLYEYLMLLKSKPEIEKTTCSTKNNMNQV